MKKNKPVVDGPFRQIRPSTRRLVDGELVIGGALNMRLFRLLDSIDRNHSINSAAKAIGMSYKGAWEMIERASSLSPRPLLDKSAGGKDGGGTRLTETGKKLLSLYLHMQEQHECFLDKLNHELSNDPVVMQWLRRLFMKASARNQWLGEVASFTQGAVEAKVTVALTGGALVVASITMESCGVLGIQPGSRVLTLVKAPMVLIMTDMEGYDLSTDNQLSGTVSQIRTGPVSSEIFVDLPGGECIVSSITTESCHALNLVVGSQVTAAFNASSVILGTPSGHDGAH